MKKNHRKAIMKIAKVMVLAVLVGGISIGLGGLASGGETIRFLAAADPYYEGLKKLVPEFEKETGIKVIIEGYEYGIMGSKLRLDLATGTAIYDVDAVDSPWAPEFGDAKYLLDLGPFLERDAEEVNAQDIVALDLGEWQGVQYAIPLATYVWLVHYRDDLFKDYGIDVPRTWDEYYDTAEKLTLDRNGDGKVDFWGTALKGFAGHNPEWWESFLYTNGARFFRDLQKGDYYPLFDSTEVRKATDLWYSFREFSPPDTGNWSIFDVTDALITDRVAMIGMWDWAYGFINDPEKSKVIGKIKSTTSMVAKGIDAPPTLTAPWLIAINKDSKNPEAAWKFVKWATSGETQLKLALGEYLAPNRMSQLADPALQKKVPVIGAMYEALGAGYFYEPYMPKTAELVAEVITVRLNAMLTGTNSVDEGLRLMQQEALELLGFEK